MLENIIVILCVIIPVFLLMLYVYARDQQEKEPIILILIAFFLGIISIFLGRQTWKFILSKIPELAEEVQNPNLYVKFLISYGAIGLIEETTKYIILNIISRNRNYDYAYDGIVYAVSISLGFALVEGIYYGIENNITVTLVRSILTIPMHMSYGVFMGYYISKSRIQDKRKFYYCYMALLYPIFIHGTSDYMLSIFNEFSLIIYIIYSIIIYILGLKKINELSRFDKKL